jgi:hypothetical protein
VWCGGGGGVDWMKGDEGGEQQLNKARDKREREHKKE